MNGLHLTADLHDCRCDSAWLLDAAQLGRACRSATLAAGLQVVNEVFHTFPASTHGPGGVTATLLEWDDKIPSFDEVHDEALKANEYIAGARAVLGGGVPSPREARATRPATRGVRAPRLQQN